ncbi:AAA family ATPase [Streptomyces yunnanensis]|uniref:AAA family ATPase n=1 Tax=Streptomyces yunnanensis TaxID=156453 RepID=A0ABY8A1T5_9ACTN|nr:AAA family ATPase [Streptomyces yunnanensis]WEB38748.1 AAA family ATPase [Streptomyces yunnanensis]
MTQIKGAAGEPLPSPFPGLEKRETQFRRGEFSIIAAGPGTFKSMFSLLLAIHANRPTLYLSADSNAATQLARAGTMLTGVPSKVMKRKVREDDLDDVKKVLADRWWLRFNVSAQPTLDELERDVACYEEVYGRGLFPHLIVVDNITNLENNSADAESFTFSLENMCDYLNSMARETNAHVLALHHVTGEWSDGLKPIPLSGVKGKIGRVPSMILTIHKEVDDMDNSTIHVSTVKNREGFVDPSGNSFVSYKFDTNSLTVTEVSGEFF